jgi:hypothetical protein
MSSVNLMRMQLEKGKYVEFKGVSRLPNDRKNETRMTKRPKATLQLRIKWNW